MNFLKRLSSLGIAAFLATSSLLAVNFGQAFAAGPYTCTWSGAGDGSHFSDASNWSGCNSAAPQPADNDNLVFDKTSLSSSPTLVNDVVGLQLGSISFTGTGGFDYTINGSTMTLTNGIASSLQSSPVVSAGLVISGGQTFNEAGFLDLAGPVSGSGLITLTGGGALAFDGDNSSFSGGISTNDGDVNANSATALGTGTTTITDGGGLIVNFDSNTTFSTPLSLGGNGVSGDPSSAALYMNTLAFAGDNSTATWSGPITLTSNILVGGFGDRILKVTGPLSGNFSMTPATADSNGVILNNSSNNTSNTPSGYVPVTVQSGDNQPGTNYTIDNLLTYIIDGTRGDITVNSGGTLKGTGTVGNLTVNSGGTVAPGHSPGCLNTGNLTLTGTYQAEIGGTTPCSGYDQLNVTGTVDVSNSTLTVNLYNGYQPKAGESYTIIKNDAADAVTGTFSGLAEGATFKVDNYVFKVTYKGGDGNDVVLSVVSVPSTPNTGFGMISNNPVAILALTTLAAGSIAGIARQTKKSTLHR